MERDYYIIGLPDSGKTSFIGALGYYLISDSGNRSRLSLDKVNDMEYINTIAAGWAKCEKVSRTFKNKFYNTRLNLIEKETGNEIMVSLPDQSGETFRHIVSSSVIDEEKYNQLLQSSGIFVFINPSKTERDALIPDIPEAIRNETDEQIEIVSEFRLNIQAEYIKILQYLYYIKKDNINLKIIVSAWDMYPEYKTPEQVIRDKVPLIWQFLYTNSELYKCEYWGLSAQGGDLDDPEVYKKLEDYENQSERIIVVDSKGNKSNDITNILI